MPTMNQVILMGNLTRDPELRTVPSGSHVADLGLAVNDGYKDKDGKWVERATFVDVVVWGRQAEQSAEHLAKGDPVMIEGKLQLDQWETDQGEKRSKLRVRAWRIHFMGTPKRDAPHTKDADASDAPRDEEVDHPF